MLIIVCGEDSFRSRLRLNEYRKKFFEKYGSQASYIFFDTEEKGGLNFQDLLGTGSLFSSTRLIVIKNYIQNSSSKDRQDMINYLEQHKSIVLEKSTVLVFWEKGLPEKENVFLKYLKRIAIYEFFERLEGLRLAGWIRARLKEMNPAVNISRPALENLISYTEGEMEIINNELHKLICYKNTGEITAAEVDCLVSTKASSNIFATIESAVSGHKKTAILLLHRQLQNNADPFYILSMYLYQFRNLLKVKSFIHEKETDKYSIAKKAGLHSYVVQKALAQLRYFTILQLKSAYARLGEIDLEVKSGKVDIDLALDKFLVETQGDGTHSTSLLKDI